MRHLAGLLLPLLLALAVFGPARGQKLDAGKRVALVIGNGEYRAVERLPEAGGDARLVASALQGLGFRLVGGGAQLDLDRAHLAQAVQDFGRGLTGAETAVFYYAGYGLQMDGVNWLAPVDANPAQSQDVEFQMVDAGLVLNQTEGEARLTLLLLDACRDNPFATPGLRGLPGGLAEMRAPAGTLISFAAQPGSVAAGGAGAESPYAQALAAGMRQPGVDALRLLDQVSQQVKRSTEGSQRPWVASPPLAGEAVRVSLPAAAPVAPQEPLPSPGDQLVTEIRGFACSVLEARATGNTVEVSGLVLAGPAWRALAAKTAPSRGLRLVTSDVEYLQPFACDPVDVLGEAVRAAHQAGGGPALEMSRREQSAGHALDVTLRGGGGDFVVLDVFRPDGVVEHLQTPAQPVKGDVQLHLAASGVSAPGPRLLSGVFSPAPLDLGPRPGSEPTGRYLLRLRQALQAPGVQADVTVFELQPAIVAAKAAVPAPGRVAGGASNACSAMLEKAQLGETLSDSERTMLQTKCH